MAIIARIRDLAEQGSKYKDIPQSLDNITDELSDEDIQELQLVVVSKKVDNLINVILTLEQRIEAIENKPTIWDRLLKREKHH